jgi:hypothetical protein
MHKLVSVFVAAALTSIPALANAQDNPVQFRTAMGLGALGVVDQNGNTISGSSLAIEGYFGGHLGNHLVLGAYLSDTASFLNGTASDINLFVIGPYLDWFSRSDALGWHLMLGSGISALNVSAMRTDTALGGNLSAGLGFDWPLRINGESTDGKIGFMFKDSTSGASYSNGWQNIVVAPTLFLTISR